MYSTRTPLGEEDQHKSSPSTAPLVRQGGARMKYQWSHSMCEALLVLSTINLTPAPCLFVASEERGELDHHPSSIDAVLCCTVRNSKCVFPVQ